MNPPTPEALALVVEALREAYKAGDGSPFDWELHHFEGLAKALLQNLDALSGNNDREVCHQEEQKKLSVPDRAKGEPRIKQDTLPTHWMPLPAPPTNGPDLS